LERKCFRWEFLRIEKRGIISDIVQYH
jgi:hypothetical protein